jgi:hypothetical protein
MSSAKRRFCEVEKGMMRIDSAIDLPPRFPSPSSSTSTLILHDGPVSGSIAETFFFGGEASADAGRLSTRAAAPERCIATVRSASIMKNCPGPEHSCR